MAWDRRVVLVLALLAAALLFAAGVKYAQMRAAPAPVVLSAPPTAGQGEPDRPKTVKVHVSGAVARPGVYELPTGARVIEAVEEAGPLPEADLDALNLAAPLMDGQKIPVPRKGEAARLPAAAGGGSPAGTLININTASAAELEALPGIGPSLAQRIVAYREEHGPFRTIEDIKNVSGIGEGRFAQIKDLITVY